MLAAALPAMVAMGAVIATPHAASAATAPVALGSAANFGFLAGLTVNNVGPSLVTGDLGASPGAVVTGFPPGTVTGTIHAGDAVAAQAQTALTAAYTDAAGRTATASVPTQLGGTTLTSGVYTSTSGTFALTGNLTLDAQGDPSAVFIFKTTTTLATSAGSRVTLTGGTQACNVFWQTGTTASLGAGSSFAGNILANGAITTSAGVILNGRALSRSGASALNTTQVRRPVCVGRGTAVAVTTSCWDPKSRGPVVLTATVRSEGTTAPTGQVVFLADGVSLGASTLDSRGRATMVGRGLDEGGHDITAFYPGSTSFDSSVSATIAQRLGPGGSCPEHCDEEDGEKGVHGSESDKADKRREDHHHHHHAKKDDNIVEFATVRTITGVVGERGGHRHHHSRHDSHHGHNGGHQGGHQGAVRGEHRGHAKGHRSQARPAAQGQRRPGVAVTG
ncbi:ice-binding family protein [Sphaerisporangium dianthi]|uniref:Ice-binding family protein n=1 Tax=Sphaerisporangium dianthi TaxID=1436120 RepID=A0ABV9CU94_9ACTN